MPLTFDLNLFARDPVALMSFYRDLLSLPECEAARSPIYRALRLGEAELGFNAHDAYALLNLPDRIPTDTATRAFATFVVATEAEVNATAARIEPLGGRILKPPCRTYYGAWQLVAEDPEGNVFRVNHRG